jgi:hypothetical protein
LYIQNVNFNCVNQPFAISHVDIGENASSQKFVFWQVLWAAFVWTKQAKFGRDQVLASDFANKVSSQFERLDTYLDRLDDAAVEILRQCYVQLDGETANIREKGINDAVQIIGDYCFPELKTNGPKRDWIRSFRSS